MLRYQNLLNPQARFGAVMMNRFYDGGGYGHLFGLDGLFLLNQNWRLSFELFKNFNKEPVQDWIDTDQRIQGKTIALDGDKLNGDALYIQLYRKTEYWQSYLYYRNISPQYRADVGFVVKTIVNGNLLSRVPQYSQQAWDSIFWFRNENRHGVYF